ncbi:MAG TPA: hypothetical protein PLQ34_04255 [Ferrovaceae bacterium]|nr:hypothetical protein [Ferrovaceae bacterium]
MATWSAYSMASRCAYSISFRATTTASRLLAKQLFAMPIATS